MPDASSTDLDAVADELYAVRPDEFVPQRDEAVGRAKEAGDRDLAKAIAKLRRPTRAAWLSNLLARNRPDKLEGLLQLAAGLADAQRTLDGAALRTLSTQRHRLVAAVANEAGRLAAAQHEPVGDGLLRDLQGILEAALADPVIADEVRSGRLTRTVSYSGFGPAADPDAVPTPAPRTAATPDTPPPAPPPPAPDERERARREEALAAAVAEEAAALDRQHADESARDEAVEAREAAKSRVAELSAELEAARLREREATSAAREAEVTAKASARAAVQAGTAAARARARVEEL